MKAIKIITHPYLLISTFLMIVISGEHFGGFYVLYLLMALLVGAIHSVLAVLGICFLLFSYHYFQTRDKALQKSALNIVGWLLLLASIYLFFLNDKEHYNYGTFYQAIPLASIIIFLAISLLFFVKNFWEILKSKDVRQELQLPNN